MELSQDKVSAYKNEITNMKQSMPEMTEAYHQFTGVCFREGELDEKTKQLIALGISLFANNELCTLYHMQEARSKGASEQAIMEAVAVASAASAGHAMAQGLMRVQPNLH
ncbi:MULTISPECIES: carboxymuconolactone decarboxylase family protein [Paenibacillus]|uniref:Carboxymuconolactone decarboxylase family protein n=1 Tax=Paenibacillus campinasensis TaxID=66347 RepID=A0A268F0Q0_9BACL|nr:MULTISPECIES: carboxymuconolactone decarboxylase family protein [Paenibacillus]MUG65526.1 carboxymuconolactone decarboxylase family protein [Paenibacillus campinasensis]PAD78942.1 gamma-carboxymuconolactone decarboxylase [Paenibacillus campinasensis]PAK53917.1 gamma-carboxymuconolactone decarboxylase [Paenibacillus sp. 7541]